MPRRADGGTTLDTIAEKLSFGHPDNRTMLEAITLISRIRRVLEAADHVKECIEDKVIEAKDIDSIDALDELKFAVEALVGKELYKSSLGYGTLESNRGDDYASALKKDQKTAPLYRSYSGSYGTGGTAAPGSYATAPKAPASTALYSSSRTTSAPTGPGKVSRVGSADLPAPKKPVDSSTTQAMQFDSDGNMYKDDGKGRTMYWHAHQGWTYNKPVKGTEIVPASKADHDIVYEAVPNPKEANSLLGKIESVLADENLLDVEEEEIKTNPGIVAIRDTLALAAADSKSTLPGGWPRIAPPKSEKEPVKPTPMGLRVKED